MKNKKFFFAILMSFLMIVGPSICAATTSVLFYETDKVGKNYRIGSGYSVFKEELETKGYSVSRIELSLSREVLRSYDPDVLVIADLQKTLDASELAAIFEFVMQDGKGLFICGGTSAANQITIPFGMTIDEGGILEDETSSIMVSGTTLDPETTHFALYSIEKQEQSLRLLVQGVNSLGFFEGSGITISGDTMVVVRGDWDTYSPKSTTFPKESRPPVATASLVGNGMVFLLSDSDMLANDKVDQSKYRFDNLRFGVNTIGWLSSSTLKPSDDATLDELRSMISQLTWERNDLNKSLIAMSTEVQNLGSTIETLSVERDDALTRYTELSNKKILGFDPATVGMIAIGGGFILLALVISGKKKKSSGKTADSGDLGYEFDEDIPNAGFSEGVDEFTGMSDSGEEEK